MKKVTKTEMVDNIYGASKWERQAVQGIVDLFLEELKKQMMEGAVVELRGFGTFEPKLRNGRKDARNPKTGETHDVAPHYISHFRAGQDLKEALKNLPVKTDEK